MTEEQKLEYLAIIEEESMRLADMATNVMNISKIEKQTILTDVTQFNLPEPLRSSVLPEEKWSKKEIIPDPEFPEYTVRGNEEPLKEVWINLLDNVIKLFPVHGEILVRAEALQGRIAVSVTNYSPDIPLEKQDKIWGKFYQADESHMPPGEMDRPSGSKAGGRAPRRQGIGEKRRRSDGVHCEAAKINFVTDCLRFVQSYFRFSFAKDSILVYRNGKNSRESVKGT